MICLAALLLFFQTALPNQLEFRSREARMLLRDRQYAKASEQARQIYTEAVAALKARPLDREPQLPLALGAAIEVEAQAMSAQGARANAVTYLQGELRRFYGTSIRARIQKNIHLLSLEGKPAPALVMTGVLGPRPSPLRNRPVLLFFWAHWCSDCRQDAPLVARLQKEFPQLTIIGPTQHYGYVEGGQDAAPAQETAYIERVRGEFFRSFPVPVNEENFRNFGASTTPTFVLLDRGGIVRLYHPGAMTYSELASAVGPLTRSGG